MFIVASIILTLLLILLGALLLLSPGKPKLFLDNNGQPVKGSISEKIHVNINGAEQGMFIRGKDKTKPILLYLHGGMPDYFLSGKYPTKLEDDFVVCWWEQRGTGLSYCPESPREAVTEKQLISDTLEVTDYLRNRFGKEKIYLMGHSGGTFIGVQVAAQSPQSYHAYIGVAQMSHQLKSEKLAYDYMLQQYKDKKDTKMTQRLEAAPVTLPGGTPKAYLALRDTGLHALGVGTARDIKSVITGIFLPSITSREYTLTEKINLWRAKARSGVSVIWDKMLNTDLAKKVPKLDIPTYFFHGAYDYTCSYTEAKSYFEKLKAPVKGFYTFENSAHSPIFEEPNKMGKILRKDVLGGANRLADIK